MAVAAPVAAFVAAIVLMWVYLGTWDGNPDIISAERIAQLQKGAGGDAADLDATLTLDATRVATHFVTWANCVLAAALALALAWNFTALAGERKVAGPASQTRSLGLWVALLVAYLGATGLLWWLLIVPHDLGALIDVPRHLWGGAPAFIAGLAVYWAGTAWGASRVMKPSVPFASFLV
ncbi:MAG TPA: hypothetical protein VE891_13345 [Allosphingosinicella sp.]|nr:hypothetical protein [Allosphingosinicella sp.]